MTRADQLMSAIQRKFKTPGRALAALGFNARTINEIIAEGKGMKNRRLAHDQMPATSEQAIEQIAQIFEALPDDEAETLADELEQRLDDTGPAADQSFRRGRRARDRRVARDQPPAFAGRPSPGGSAVGIWDSARDQRQRRPAAMDSAQGKLPTTEEIWPNAMKNRVA